MKNFVEPSASSGFFWEPEEFIRCDHCECGHDDPYECSQCDAVVCYGCWSDDSDQVCVKCSSMEGER